MTSRIVLLCAAAALLPTSAFAWGNEGHRIVCEIALQRLSPAARTFVDNVRALHTEIKDGFDDCQANSCSPKHPSDARDMSFLEGCIWADESRRDTCKDTYEYHFINMPKAAAGFDLLRDCGMFDCVLVGIQRFSQYLALQPSSSSREKDLTHPAHGTLLVVDAWSTKKRPAVEEGGPMREAAS
jgi:hypothetical protein